MKRPTETLPDPWLFDSEALLRELDRCSETVLQIPINEPKMPLISAFNWP